jgi:hypothetical protein
MTHYRKRRGSKNFLNKSVSIAKTTSRKYIPKMKHSIENVGSEVIKSGHDSVPFLQRMTRKLFGFLGVKSKKRRHRY